MKSDAMKNAIDNLIQNIKDEKFYEAHEELEHFWKELKKQDHPLKNLVKGYINGATAFELVKRGKMDAARRVWATYEKYLVLIDKDIECYDEFVEADKLLQELKNKRL